jgi:localization factor PodJL
LISVAGYFLIPRGTTPTVEIAAQPGGSTQTNAPEPQAGSTFDQAVARANTGDARAMLSLSLAYAGGIGVERSDSEAQMWLERAAQAGEPVAQFQFGVGYEKGIGVAADPKQAAHWYLESATHGNVKAMYNLGVSYANGTGIEKNLAEAAHWFQSAAELGLTDAQFNLAVLYEHGLGVDASLADAYKWYAIAATGGDMDSKARTEALATQIPSAQKDAADQAIAAFKPQPVAPEVNEAPAPAGATTP